MISLDQLAGMRIIYLYLFSRSGTTLFASFSGKRRNSLDQLAWFGAYVILMAFREAEQRFLLLFLEKEESH
jgi:hypothetical protein